MKTLLALSLATLACGCATSSYPVVVQTPYGPRQCILHVQSFAVSAASWVDTCTDRLGQDAIKDVVASRIK